VTLLLRRQGRGNWSVLRLQYDAARQGQMPTLVQAKVGDLIDVCGVVYRVSGIEP
jgi:hypothetical protein